MDGRIWFRLIQTILCVSFAIYKTHKSHETASTTGTLITAREALAGEDNDLPSTEANRRWNVPSAETMLLLRRPNQLFLHLLMYQRSPGIVALPCFEFPLEIPMRFQWYSCRGMFPTGKKSLFYVRRLEAQEELGDRRRIAVSVARTCCCGMVCFARMVPFRWRARWGSVECRFLPGEWTVGQRAGDRIHFFRVFWIFRSLVWGRSERRIDPLVIGASHIA
jgi:hypothetical protein